MEKSGRKLFQTHIVSRRWLTDRLFEVNLKRPLGFSFIPGQKVQISIKDVKREYTLINSPDARELVLCIRYIEGGKFSPVLAEGDVGLSLSLSSATGFFTYQTQINKPVFVATGTGIAPFLAFIRSGVTGFILLHGVRSKEDLLYREEIAGAGMYIPCVSEPTGNSTLYEGYVTEYIEKILPKSENDFYLCGNRAMIHDAFEIIDRKFPGSKVFAEPFY